MNPEEAQELLHGLAEEALSGRSGEVVCLEAPEWLPLPPSLRRQLDGHSVYSRPGVTRYATTAQLTLEERLVAHAQTQGAPRLPSELAARRLGADPALTANQTAKPRTDQTDAMRRNHQRAMRKRRNRHSYKSAVTAISSPYVTSSEL